MSTALLIESKNILLLINFDFMTVLPELGLSIAISYKGHLINIKKKPKYWKHE